MSHKTEDKPPAEELRQRAQRPARKELRDKFASDDIERAARDFVDATLDFCHARRTTVADTFSVSVPFEDSVTRPQSLQPASRSLGFIRPLRNNDLQSLLTNTSLVTGGPHHV